MALWLMTLLAQTLNLSYDLTEDRLSLLLTDGQQSIRVWLTRALSQRLLMGLAEVLWRNKQIESDHPQAKEAALMMTHVAITQRPEHRQDQLQADTPEPVFKGLLTRVDIQSRQDGLVLLFYVGDECVANLPTTEASLHRVIDVLSKMVERAQWQLAESDFTWLTRRSAPLASLEIVGHC